MKHILKSFRKRRYLSVAVAIMALPLIFSFNLTAEEADRNSNIPIGYYEDFGLWQSIQLAATGLISPHRLENTAVVYAYSGNDISDENFSKLLVSANPKVKLVAFDEKVGKFSMVSEEKLKNALETGTISKFSKEHGTKLLSYEPELLGMKPDNKMINWQAVNSPKLQ